MSEKSNPYRPSEDADPGAEMTAAQRELEKRVRGVRFAIGVMLFCGLFLLGTIAVLGVHGIGGLPVIGFASGLIGFLVDRRKVKASREQVRDEAERAGQEPAA